MEKEQPTGLEVRFDRELAATISGWRSDFPDEIPVAVQTRSCVQPPGQRILRRHRPDGRKVAAGFIRRASGKGKASA